MEFNETWREARSQRPLASLCFSCRRVNKNGRPGRSVNLKGCTLYSCARYVALWASCILYIGVGWWEKQEAQRATYRAPEYNVPPFWRNGFGSCAQKKKRKKSYRFWGQGSKAKVITKKVMVMATGSQRGLFWLCQYSRRQAKSEKKNFFSFRIRTNDPSLFNLTPYTA